MLMPIRNRAKFVLAVVVMFLVCCSAEKPVNVNVNSNAATQKTTYWVIVMWTLIGTGYISEVCPLAVDDRESVAVAARAWGARRNGGLMTLEGSVYSFTSQDEAEKFRRGKKYVSLDLNAEELKKYLCIGQPSLPPTEYWVIIMSNDEGNYISEVFPLSAYDSVNILAAAHNWGYDKGFQTDVRGAYKFASQDDAEKFRKREGYLDLKLNATELMKYLNISQPSLPPTDYWVVIISDSKGDYISEVFALPAFDSVNILAAVDNWGSKKGFKLVESGAYRFVRQEEAEKFRREKGLPDLKLTVNSLKTYLCPLKSNSANPDEPSSPSTDDGVGKQPNRPSNQRTNKKSSL